MSEFHAADVGKHCEVDNCNKLDFLPFTCIFCKSIFCLEHRTSSSHNCIKDPSDEKQGLESNKTSEASQRCEQDLCTNKELTLVVCEKCSQNFCLKHRHPQDHHCSTLLTNLNNGSKPSLNHALVLQKLQEDICKKNISSPTVTKPQGPKSKEMENKVRLMKMKLKASGPSGVPESKKIYLDVAVIPKGITRSIYFNKSWSIGKSVDWLANQEKLKNQNNIATAKKLCFIASESFLPLSATWEEALSKKIKNVELSSGDEIAFNYL